MTVKKKTAELLEGDDTRGEAFALFLRPHPGAFGQLMCPHPGEFAHFLKQNAIARGGRALLELTDALRNFVIIESSCAPSTNNL